MKIRLGLLLSAVLGLMAGQIGASGKAGAKLEPLGKKYVSDKDFSIKGWTDRDYTERYFSYFNEAVADYETYKTTSPMIAEGSLDKVVKYAEKLAPLISKTEFKEVADRARQLIDDADEHKVFYYDNAHTKPRMLRQVLVDAEKEAKTTPPEPSLPAKKAVKIEAEEHVVVAPGGPGSPAVGAVKTAADAGISLDLSNKSRFLKEYNANTDHYRKAIRDLVENNPRKLLGLPSSATRDEIERASRTLLGTWRPATMEDMDGPVDWIYGQVFDASKKLKN